MARWEPDARGRLLRAALELFADRGYEATTAAQIAERAGLTKATLFRHFADKREILFQGQAASVETATAAVRSAPVDATALDLVRAGLHALVAAHVPEQQEIGRRIDLLVASSADLQERAVAKRTAIAAAMAGVMAERGVDAAVAGALADVGIRAYYDGFAAWTDVRRDDDLADLVDGHLDDLLPGLRAALTEDRPRASQQDDRA